MDKDKAAENMAMARGYIVLVRVCYFASFLKEANWSKAGALFAPGFAQGGRASGSALEIATQA